MFNLLVTSDGSAWEDDLSGSMMTGRFKEYSGGEADAINLEDSKSLKILERIPTLLMYEVGAEGPNPRLVRHVTLSNIHRNAGEISFTFEPHPNQAYLTLGIILEFAATLDLHQFELHRTHWAVKDGDLPPALLEKATAAIPVRTLAVVQTEYIDAWKTEDTRRLKSLKEEISAFPSTIEKAISFLIREDITRLAPEALPHLGLSERTQDARRRIWETALAGRTNALLNTSPMSLIWSIERFGSATELTLKHYAVRRCEEVLRKHNAGTDAPGVIAHAAWHCARSQTLPRRFRSILNTLLDLLSARRAGDGSWLEHDDNPTSDIRTTAQATVTLQRLGNDKHRGGIRQSVLWLCDHRLDCKVWAQSEANSEPDVFASVLALEAIRRSDLLGELLHVIEEGEAWLLAAQQPLGGWQAAGLDDDYATALVLDYFTSRSAMLPQVDGFFLMAREFFRKAEDLAQEDSINSRRLAAIASVHAMEMFLYGLFERREDLGLSAYKESGTETLGPREALRALQDRLLATGHLAPPKRLKYRDLLSGMVGHRDGIIHRAQEISAEELHRGMQATRDFVEHYGSQLLTLDLLQ